MNNQWDQYAVNNNAADLASPNIIGLSLWEFIHGEDVRKLYEDVLASVRSQKKTVSFPYRCDTELDKQYLTLTLTPFMQNNSVQFYSRIVDKIPFKTDKPVKLDFGKSGILRCSVCNRLHCQNEWVEPEKAVNYGLLATIDDKIKPYQPSAETVIKGYEQVDRPATSTTPPCRSTPSFVLSFSSLKETKTSNLLMP